MFLYSLEVDDHSLNLSLPTNRILFVSTQPIELLKQIQEAESSETCIHFWTWINAEIRMMKKTKCLQEEKCMLEEGKNGVARCFMRNQDLVYNKACFLKCGRKKIMIVVCNIAWLMFLFLYLY